MRSRFESSITGPVGSQFTRSANASSQLIGPSISMPFDNNFNESGCSSKMPRICEHKKPKPHLRRDRLIASHTHIVISIARRTHENLPSGIEFKELVAAGNEGLLQAAQQFNPRYGVKFANFAKFRIHGAMLDVLRSLDHLSRGDRQAMKKISATVESLTAQLHRDPTDLEVARKMTLGVSHYRLLRRKLKATCAAPPMSLQVVGDHEAFFAQRPEQTATAVQGQARKLIDESAASLSPRYRKVVELYYQGEMTMQQIAKTMGINESRVCQIHKAALLKMQVALQDRGVRRTGDVF